ncbi:Ribose operon repressor [Caballeronia glathei]|jgi:DNA-binding LacI/PurR family transcriptional regulator|uniref:LacI family transcriptional regulator n=1 Tax=Caballeronia glathei TaxID=60547 RepID=A0A069PPB6_9BURK|nr:MULTISPECIES: LacI family DNA-binding transcriptional regulator [Burkholderiaceae]KDR41689.1 LacI family transcriptional regulator [Caballeronia glathei]TCK36379.1 LacI family transcriptional regulator [Paraburkholderia sp. BL8N3]CDY78168.1 Ribose operon repressor [Caballeronia glathei]
MTTLTEVAKLAGVTAATVSNVLRKRGKVGEATRKRVLEAVDALGYRPHLTARALAEGSAPTLALMVSSIANPFYPEFALAAERAARESGRFLIVCNTNEDPAIGRAYLEQIAGTLSEGVLVMNANLDFDDLRKTQARGTAVVLCMWERPGAPPGMPCIAVDFFAAGAIAARHLLDLGHTRIGAIIGSPPGGVQAARYEGFCATLREAGIAHVPAESRFTRDSIRGGYEAASELLAAFPDLTAIFATNDLPALGATHAAADAGLRIPEDLSVIGITDIQLARESRPALSTVAVPTEIAATMAVKLLRALIDGSAAGALMQVAPTPGLVVRASTGAARKQYP